jgi:hypothetical protein
VTPASPIVVAVPDDDVALSALPTEEGSAATRTTEPARSVRLDVDDVPELPAPAEAGEEAWREVRQAVLQSEAWREREEPRRRWLPSALAFGGAAALALAAYALWPARAVPTGASSQPPRHAAAEPPAAPAANTTTTQALLPSTPIGTSGTGDPATAATPADKPAAAAPSPATVTPPVSVARIEIQTTREVWMRTTVDGEPPVERLVPGGRTLRFDPTQALVLRAGDAGGLRVVVDGEDRGVLGADGQVVTRRYELSPKKARP